jgi:hypothetical protein
MGAAYRGSSVATETTDAQLPASHYPPQYSSIVLTTQTLPLAAIDAGNQNHDYLSRDYGDALICSEGLANLR